MGPVNGIGPVNGVGPVNSAEPVGGVGPVSGVEPMGSRPPCGGKDGEDRVGNPPGTAAEDEKLNDMVTGKLHEWCQVMQGPLIQAMHCATICQLHTMSCRCTTHGQTWCINKF